MMRRASLLSATVMLVVIGTGCPSAMGGEKQPCYGNMTCNPGLACLSDLCVNNRGPDAGATVGDAGAPADAGTPGFDAGSPVDAGNAGPPALGPQIDRVGRPMISSAFVDFTAASRGQKLDEWNAAPRPDWSSLNVELSPSLAMYDALDGCGDSAFIGQAPPKYLNASVLLANDQLFFDTRLGTCLTVLAVERHVTGDCGGRAPRVDAVDQMYSLFINGQTSGVTDGITAPADLSTTFPFFGAP